MCAAPGRQGEEPVTTSEEATRLLQAPVDSQAAAAVRTVSVATVLPRVLHKDSATVIPGMATTTRKERGEVGEGEGATRGGEDTTGTVGEGEVVVAGVQHPRPAMVGQTIKR